MPQIKLEYSANITEINSRSVLADIHAALADVTDINTCKSRSQIIKNFFVGKGEPQNAIVHLKIELLDLPQRTPEVRQSLAEKISAILDQYFLPRIQALGLNCKPTVHIAKLKVYRISSAIYGSGSSIQPSQPSTELTQLQARL